MAAIRHLGFVVRMCGTTRDVLLGVFITVQTLVQICLFAPLLKRFLEIRLHKWRASLTGSPKGTFLRGTTPFDV